MTTAEKRAALEAAGVPWPDCDCHDVPMLWQRDMSLNAGGRFHCRIVDRENRSRKRAARLAAGSCIHCGGPLATTTLCRSCADSHADIMGQPKQKLLHQFAVIRHRGRLRADEGFRPTGVGPAVFAAWTKEGLD